MFPWSLQNSNEQIRSDIERLTKDLTMLTEAGFGNGTGANDLRSYIACYSELIIR
jgi:hypothetical protein